jgi:hypothetical protein
MHIFKTKTKFMLILTLMMLPSCSLFSDETSTEDFENYVSSKRIGAGPDYWLAIKNRYGQWERVAVFYGYFFDEDTKISCEKSMMGLSETYSDREYRCERAN